MAELIHECDHEVAAAGGRSYRPQVLGEARGNIWAGWLEFVAGDGSPSLRTEVETTQPDRDALAYWASGLEPVYLEGGLRRAQ